MRTPLEALVAGCLIRPGVILSLLGDGHLLVEAEDALLPALFVRTSAGPLPALKAGDEVLVAVDAARARAYVLGLIGPYEAPEPPSMAPFAESAGEVVHVRARRVHIEAGEELRLQCGEGTLVMDRRGKVVVRGTQLVSRARGANKIKGASVAIN